MKYNIFKEIKFDEYPKNTLLARETQKEFKKKFEEENSKINKKNLIKLEKQNYTIKS